MEHKWILYDHKKTTCMLAVPASCELYYHQRAHTAEGKRLTARPEKTMVCGVAAMYGGHPAFETTCTTSNAAATSTTVVNPIAP